MAGYNKVTDDEGYELDENGERVLPNEPQMSHKTGKRKKAKPRVLTDAKINRICEKIKEGNFVKQSCIACGVNYNGFQTAMRQGKKGIRPYDKWYEMIEMAKAQAEYLVKTGKMPDNKKKGHHTKKNKGKKAFKN